MVYASPGSGLTEAGKYKLGAKAVKYKLGARAGKHKLGTKAGKYKLGTMAGKYKLGARAKARAGGQAESWRPGNTNTRIKCIADFQELNI